MSVKYYLQQLIYIDEDINSRLAELAQVRANLQVAKTSRIKDVSVQETNSVYDDRYLKLFEMEQTIDQEIKRLIDLKAEARVKIDKCEDPLHRIILREHYINSKSWEEIAEDLNMSKRHVLRVHGSALVDFQRMSPNVTKCH